VSQIIANNVEIGEFGGKKAPRGQTITSLAALSVKAYGILHMNHYEQ
jgi:hypothetical protein